MFSGQTDFFSRHNFRGPPKPAKPDISGLECLKCYVRTMQDPLAFVVTASVNWSDFLGVLKQHLKLNDITVNRVTLGGEDIHVSPTDTLKRMLGIGSGNTECTIEIEIVCFYVGLSGERVKAYDQYVVDISSLGSPFDYNASFSAPDNDEIIFDAFSTTPPSQHKSKKTHIPKKAKYQDSESRDEYAEPRDDLSKINERLHVVQNQLARMSEIHRKANMDTDALDRTVKEEIGRLRSDIKKIDNDLKLQTASINVIIQRGAKVEEMLATVSGLCLDLCMSMNAMREELGTLRNAVTPEEQKCSICMENAKDVALVPCGHTFCHACATELIKNPGCPNCRKSIESVCKLYF